MIEAIAQGSHALVPSDGSATKETQPGFGEALDRLVGAVTASTNTANVAVGKMLDGSGEVHEAMIAVQQADLTMQLAVQIRNKIVSAYQEMSRMPV